MPSQKIHKLHTKNHSVKPVKLGESTQVSHLHIVYQPITGV